LYIRKHEQRKRIMDQTQGLKHSLQGKFTTCWIPGKHVSKQLYSILSKSSFGWRNLKFCSTWWYFLLVAEQTTTPSKHYIFAGHSTGLSKEAVLHRYENHCIFCTTMLY
jgi:hypothetical protein